MRFSEWLNLQEAHKQLADEVRDQVKDMILQGKSFEEITKELGISLNTVSDIKSQMGISKKLQKTINSRRVQISKDKRSQQIKDMLVQGGTIGEISKKLGIDSNVVKRVKNKANLPDDLRSQIASRFPAAITDEKRNQVIDLLKQGEMSMRQISKETGVPRVSVQRIRASVEVPDNKLKQAASKALARGRSISDEKKQQVIEMINSGNLSDAAISTQTGVNRLMVAKIRMQYALSSTPQQSPNVDKSFSHFAGYNQWFDDRLRAMMSLDATRNPKSHLPLLNHDWVGDMVKVAKKYGFDQDRTEEFIQRVVTWIMEKPTRIFNPKTFDPSRGKLRTFWWSHLLYAANDFRRYLNRVRQMPTDKDGNVLNEPTAAPSVARDSGEDVDRLRQYIRTNPDVTYPQLMKQFNLTKEQLTQMLMQMRS